MPYECSYCGQPTKSFVTWQNKDYCVSKCIGLVKLEAQTLQDKLANTALCQSRGCSRAIQPDARYCSKHQPDKEAKKPRKGSTAQPSPATAKSSRRQQKQQRQNRRQYAKQLQRHFSAGCSRCGSRVLLLGPSKAKPCLCSKCYICDRMDEDEALGLLIKPYAQLPSHYQEYNESAGSHAEILAALRSVQYPNDNAKEQQDD